VGEQFGGDLGGQRRLAGSNRFQGLDELFEAGALQEVAARPRPQRRDEVVFVFGGRDDDDLDVR
jgi:hypothetical protein